MRKHSTKADPGENLDCISLHWMMFWVWFIHLKRWLSKAVKQGQWRLQILGNRILGNILEMFWKLSLLLFFSPWISPFGLDVRIVTCLAARQFISNLYFLHFALQLNKIWIFSCLVWTVFVLSCWSNRYLWSQAKSIKSQKM